VTAGGHKVWGPGTSNIADNNAFALAIIMTIPIVIYLFTHSRNVLLRSALAGGIFLLIVAVIGTASRGGLVGILALGAWILLTTKRKFAFLVLGLPMALIALTFAPDVWYQRMSTIESASDDSSFMGRVIAWKINTLAAIDHPLTGAGFQSTNDLGIWLHYAREFSTLDFIPTPPPDPVAAHAAHSIYFQVLGDMGFVGLAIFLLLLMAAWRNSSITVARSRNRPELRWAGDLARTFQYCLVPYMVSGAALNMAYFDLTFSIVALLAVLRERMEQQVLVPREVPDVLPRAI
jgi:putative inorganic carbon (hco3(-)) transporter